MEKKSVQSLKDEIIDLSKNAKAKQIRNASKQIVKHFKDLVASQKYDLFSLLEAEINKNVGHKKGSLKELLFVFQEDLGMTRKLGTTYSSVDYSKLEKPINKRANIGTVRR